MSHVKDSLERHLWFFTASEGSFQAFFTWKVSSETVSFQVVFPCDIIDGPQST